MDSNNEDYEDELDQYLKLKPALLARAPEKIPGGFIYRNLQHGVGGVSNRHVIYRKLHIFLPLYPG